MLRVRVEGFRGGLQRHCVSIGGLHLNGNSPYLDGTVLAVKPVTHPKDVEKPPPTKRHTVCFRETLIAVSTKERMGFTSIFLVTKKRIAVANFGLLDSVIRISRCVELGKEAVYKEVEGL